MWTHFQKVISIMFRPAVNQVAGHQAGVGKLGPVVDSAGRFYKPLQDGERGQREKIFYEQFWADESVPDTIKAFFPAYYGTERIEASDGSGLIDHIVLEDLTSRFLRPCAMDIKMGLHTWYPGASDSYIAKCKEKDAETTSNVLGFRISGLQVFDSTTQAMWKPGRIWCKMLTVEGTKLALKQFVSSNPADSVNPDLAFGSIVYKSPMGLISQLTELRKWFDSQTSYHFYSSSILLMFESDTTSEGNMCSSVKLVDFAHVLTGQAAQDDNFLKGLDSLIHILQEM